MASPALRYGIPDIILPRVGGGVINPGAFVGHELVVFFCPPDPADAEAEIRAYRSLLRGFEDGGAWVMGILTGGALPNMVDGIALALDDGADAWRAFASLVGEGETGSPEGGGAFLFGRGGCLTHAWAGAGHAEHVLSALRERD
jgi:peroxiredoxin